MNIYKKLLFTLLSLFFFTTVQVVKAQQNFPIISNLQLTPPYSLYLSDYSQVGSNKLQLSLFLRDLTKNNYPCKVSLKIEGFGITISSNPNINPSPIYLNAGQLKVITGDELYPYLNPANLVFQGLSYQAFQNSGGKLPEGVYRITFEVKDFYNNKLVANDATTVLSAFLSYPPFINLPLPNAVVNSLEPQNVLFQWTPRHTASINAAYNVAYKFTLVELTPPDRDPNNAIQTTAPIYETFTDQTFMVYGPGQPTLTKGNSYALKVQAVEASGRDMFINDGNSEVVKFTYGNACETPVNVFAELANQGALKVSWLPWPGQEQFSIRYRERNLEGAAWFDQTVTQPYAVLTGLRAGAVYEFQVKSVCAGGNAAYSALQWFQLPTEDMLSGDLVCGTAPNITVDTTNLISALSPGTFFLAGSFPITVTSVTGNGTFNGIGTVGVPFLDVANFQVTLENVVINKDMKMVGGVVRIATQPLDASQEDLYAALTITPNTNGNVTAIYSNGLPNIVKVTIPNPAELPVYNPVNNTITFTATREGETSPQTITVQLKTGDQPPYVFQDKNGETYEVSKDANGTVSVTKRDKQPISSMMAGVEQSQKPIDQSGGNSVIFTASTTQKYGFDTFNIALKDNALSNKNYKPLDNGTTDRANWKSVESGRGDVLTATLNGSLIADSLQFRNGNGERIAATRSGNTFTINVLGAPEANEKEIYAYYPSGTAGDAGKNLGKINITSFNNIHKKLVIVPVNGADVGLSAAALKTGLDNIYQQAVVDWEVSIAPNFTFDLESDGLEAGDSNALSAYTAEQNALGKAYKTANGLANNTYYLFVVNNFTEAGQEGYMVRGGQVGFIKAGTPNIIKTTAHELGHGAFNLEHSWELYGAATKNTTSNLMDYNGGTELWYRQWTYMRNPDWVFRPFEGDDDGAQLSVQYNYLMPNGLPFRFKESAKINPRNVILIDTKSNGGFKNGSLYSFRVDNVIYDFKEGQFLERGTTHSYENQYNDTDRNSDFRLVIYTNANNCEYVLLQRKVENLALPDLRVPEKSIRYLLCSSNEISLMNDYSEVEQDEIWTVWTYLKDCIVSYKTQTEGYVPRCLWDHNNYIPNGFFVPYHSDPALVSGIVDGALEMGKGVLDIATFVSCFDPTNISRWVSADCFDIRSKTGKAMSQMFDLVTDRQKLASAFDQAGSSLSQYAEETGSTSNQARYNQGKIIFNVASLFIGVGEANAIIKGEKTLIAIVKESLSAYAALPKTVAKLMQRTANNGLAYIAIKTGNNGAYLAYKLANTEVKLAEFTAEKVFDAAKTINTIEGARVIETLENMPYKDNLGNTVNTTFKIVEKDGDAFIKVEVVGGAGKAALLSKLASHPNVSSLVSRLDDVTDAGLISKLEDIATNNPSKLLKLDELYNPSTFNLPADRPFLNGASGAKVGGDFTVTKVIDGQNVSVYYNKSGYPNLNQFSPGTDYNYVSNSLTGLSGDMTLANNIMKQKFLNQPSKFIWDNQSSWFEIADANGNLTRYTWHHYQDGRKMFPVPSKIHNSTEGGFNHTGGKALIIKGLQDIFE